MNFLLFELMPHLHVPEYLRALMDGWCSRERAGTLYLFVRPTFLDEHPELAGQARCAPSSGIRFLTLSAGQRSVWNNLALQSGGGELSFPDLLRGKGSDTILEYEWELFRHHALTLGASRAFVISLDRYLPLLATGADSPVPFSGIYLGPSFHYSAFDDPCTRAALDPMRIRREKFLLTRALRAPHLESLFLLDPFAVAEAQKFPLGHKARFLADPITLSPVPAARVQTLRAELGIQPDRRIFLLFGEMTRRKGIFELLDALEHLNSHGRADILAQMCVLFIGRAAPEIQRELQARLLALTGAGSLAQVITRPEYVSTPDAAAYFQMSDAILAPYPQHNGSSGILLVAAAFQKPLLASRYGLVGAWTRKYHLGLDIDVTQPAEFAGALTRLVTEEPSALCDFAQMKILAADHAPEKFAAAVFQDS